MSTLVTGAFGCLGAWVVRALLASAERPVVFDIGDDPWRMRMLVGPDVERRVVVERGDIADGVRLLQVVRQHGIRRIVHLAAWQIPLCRQDPAQGALVNVVGTANVLEAARALAGQVERIVHASSAAVFGPPSRYPPGPIANDAPPHPATHYGVYKVANEETARIYWEEHHVPSIGFRPLSVYGPGRDVGLTADPTLAMKAAVLGRKLQVRWGGRTDLIFTEDVARAFVAAAGARLDGARVYNLHGTSVAVADVLRLITEAWPSARGLSAMWSNPSPSPTRWMTPPTSASSVRRRPLRWRSACV